MEQHRLSINSCDLFPFCFHLNAPSLKEQVYRVRRDAIRHVALISSFKTRNVLLFYWFGRTGCFCSERDERQGLGAVGLFHWNQPDLNIEMSNVEQFLFRYCLFKGFFRFLLNPTKGRKCEHYNFSKGKQVNFSFTKLSANWNVQINCNKKEMQMRTWSCEVPIVWHWSRF
jgi:hypothetical protein